MKLNAALMSMIFNGVLGVAVAAVLCCVFAAPAEAGTVRGSEVSDESALAGGVSPSEANQDTTVQDPGAEKSGSGKDQPLFMENPSYEELKARAEELAKKATEDSTDYSLQFELAGIYYDMGSLMMAAKHYRKAADLNPASPKALVNLGVVLNEMGRSEEAIEAYGKALEINPKDTKAICNLGLAYYGVGRHADALTQYRAALKIDPASQEAHYNLGVAFADAQIYREAMNEWNKVIELGPESDAAKAAKANIEVIQQLIELNEKPGEKPEEKQEEKH